MDRPKKDKASKDKLFEDLAKSSERIKQAEKGRKENLRALEYMEYFVAALFFVIPFLVNVEMTFKVISWAIGIGISILIYTRRSHRD